MNRDLTVGKPERVLWQYCMPLFGSIIFQQLYNLADSFVAGKFIGEEALAAVGNSYEITLIFIAFAFGCNIGCSVIVAQLFGAKGIPRYENGGVDDDDLKRRDLCGADGNRSGAVYAASESHSYAGKYSRRFGAVPENLRAGAAVRLLL